MKPKQNFGMGFSKRGVLDNPNGIEFLLSNNLPKILSYFFIPRIIYDPVCAPVAHDIEKVLYLLILEMGRHESNVGSEEILSQGYPGVSKTLILDHVIEKSSRNCED